MKKASLRASVRSTYLGLLLGATAILSYGVQSEVAYAVGVGGGPNGFGDKTVLKAFVNRFDEWGVGNPRRVAYADINILEDGLGAICSAKWGESNLGGNHVPCFFDFNCFHSEQDLTKNEDNQGYNAAGLNCDGKQVALCSVVPHQGQLCDTDLKGISRTTPLCVPYLKCT